MLDELIEEIQNEVPIHYLSNFPQNERERIIRGINKEFLGVKVFKNEDWDTIFNDASELKIIKNLNRLLDNLGYDSRINEYAIQGSTFIIFSSANFQNQTNYDEWLEFFWGHENLIRQYIWKNKAVALPSTLKSKITKCFEWLIRGTLSIIFLFFTIAYTISECRTMTELENTNSFLKIFSIIPVIIGFLIGFLNAFFNISIYPIMKKVEKYLVKKTTPFIEKILPTIQGIRDSFKSKTKRRY